MTIYIPPHFSGDAATARQLIADHPFATLITAPGGAIHLTHVPLLLDEAGTALTGHVAKANPHWRLLESADSVAVFHGPRRLADYDADGQRMGTTPLKAAA